jgi:hypothetical protein
LERTVVRRVARHFQHHVVFEQLDRVVRREYADLDHTLIAGDGEAGGGIVVAVRHWRHRWDDNSPRKDARDYTTTGGGEQSGSASPVGGEKLFRVRSDFGID